MRNNVVLIICLLILCITNSEKLTEAGNPKTLSAKVAESHQIFADYIEIDNAYDTMQITRKSIAEYLATTFLAIKNDMNDTSRVYFASKGAQSLAQNIAYLQIAHSEIEKKNLAPALKEFKKIVVEMIELTYEDHSMANEILQEYAAAGDKILNQTLIEIKNKETQDLEAIKKRNQIESRIGELEVKLSEAQERLIAHHKQQSEEIIKAI